MKGRNASKSLGLTIPSLFFLLFDATDNWWLITSQTRADVCNIVFPTFCRCENSTQGLKCISLFRTGTHQVVKSTLCSVFLQCNPILFLFSQVSQKWAHSWGLPRLWLPSLQEGGKGNSSSAEALFTPLSQFSYLCRGIRSSSPMTILMLLFVVILNTNVDLHQAAISF